MSSSKMKPRSAVLINYFCIIIALILFYGIKYAGFSKIFLLLEIIPLICLIISFRIAFSTSNLWKLTHSSFRKLDEREIQIVYKATTYSYSIFTILCLVLIYTFYLLGFPIIDVVLAGSLLYIAHILPASIIVWNEK
ncbi:MAG: hypothetical protein U9P79_06550 [Candidatus Cloacimonadota bacterium]|nr:hypothetical protein [Candidatus Cloacimonadota bacterium]